MYELLLGITPFRDFKGQLSHGEVGNSSSHVNVEVDARERLFNRIREGRLSFTIPVHRLPLHTRPCAGLTEGTKNMVRSLLCVDPLRRLTCRQLLQSDWLVDVSIHT
jgi:serine/threonine protein kinase